MGRRYKRLPKMLPKLLSLSSADRFLLLHVGLLVAGIRLGLGLLPFRTVRRLLRKIPRVAGESWEAEQAFLRRMTWAVSVASRHVPGATCLTQALATQTLLAQGGCPTRLCIGVAAEAGRPLDAHAWVESRGQVLTGARGDLPRYRLLLALGRDDSRDP